MKYRKFGVSFHKKPWSWWFSVAAFLFFSLSLALPSGYSYGAVAFLMIALVAAREGVSMEKATVQLVGVFLMMGLLWGHAFDGFWTWSGSDNWIKYGVAAGILWVVAKQGVQFGYVQWGVAAGGVGALLIAAYQYLVLGWSKAWGFTNAIQYGGISMYLGLAAWCFALFGTQARGSKALLWAAGAAGVLASLLSETRGAWSVAPLLLGCMLWLLLRNGQVKQAITAITAALCLIVVVAVPYADKYVPRIEQAVIELQQYEKTPEQAAVTSVGQRLEQWRLAIMMGDAKPLTGWGVRGVVEGKQAYVDAGKAHPSVMGYGHAHNEILDMWAKRGAIGVFMLLLFYVVPLYWLWPSSRRLQALPAASRHNALALRAAASLLPLAYFGFGWTQVFLAHNSGNLFYLFGLMSFWGAIKHIERLPAE